MTFLTSPTDSTVAAISGTPSASQIVEVNAQIEIMVQLINEATSSCSSGELSLDDHSNTELAALVGDLLVEVEFTASYASSVCGQCESPPFTEQRSVTS